MTLKSFPRGGKKSVIKPSNALFSKHTKIKAKKKEAPVKPVKEVDSSIKESSDEPALLNAAINLRYSTLHEEMIIFGRIYKVTDYYAVVTLPGQINGKLQATDLSESYTNLLKQIASNEGTSSEFKPMSQMYSEGEYVACYVKELNPKSKKVLLSLEPRLINQNLKPSILVKGSKVTLTVSSVEDHGYSLETGLKNFRAFLSVNDLGDRETKLHPGKQIICAIKDIRADQNIFTAKVSIKSKHLESVETNIVSLDCLIPGALFSLTVKKVLKYGLQVYFGEKNVGYVNQLYLQHPLSSYEKGQEVVGTLLYIMPTVKYAFFSLLPQEQEKRLLSIGDVITKAKVLAQDSNGILMQINKKDRGFVSFKRTEVDFEKISAIFVAESIHKCKIIAYDLMTKLYICTMEKRLLEGQHTSKANLQHGMIVEVTVTKLNKKSGHLTVSIGNSSGTVPGDQVSDPGSTFKPTVNQTYRARVLDTSERPLFTLKKSLVESKLPILCKIEEAKVNSVHDGSVRKIADLGVLVRFFGGVNGWIPRHFLNHEIKSQKWNLVLGQTVTVVIKAVDIDRNKITLALQNNKMVQNLKYNIGDIVEGVVIDSSTAGVHLRLKKNNQEGTVFLPAGHMSPCLEVGKLLAAKSVPGDTLSAIVFSTNSGITLSTTFAPKAVHKINDLNPGDTILCSVKKIYKDSIKVLLPIVKHSKYGKISVKNAEKPERAYENQILFGRIIDINKKKQEINLTTQLSKVWKGVSEHEVKMMTSVDLLSVYLSKISDLSKNVYYTSRSISKINIGQKIKGSIETVTKTNLILKLEKNLKGIVRLNGPSKRYKEGDEVEGSVLWINYPHEMIEITLLPKTMKNISIEQNEQPKIPLGVLLRGEIVLITDWFVLVVLKGQGKGTLAALPARRHLNDIVPDLSPYQIGGRIRCFGVFNKEEADILVPICMLKSAFEVFDPEVKKQKISAKLKRKAEAVNSNDKAAKKMKSSDNVEEKNNAKKRKNEQNEKDTKAKKSPAETKKVKKIEETNDSKNEEDSANDETKTDVSKSVNTNSSAPKLSIPECGFQWENSKSTQASEESSSDSDEDADESVKPKKKKLTPFERRELERQKEREIREREEALANSQIPQTVDQFDKLVLSSPDSSLIWIQYMVYHLQATEIEKARAVARQALKLINFREEEERLNVWLAFLNLESRFGSLESLNEVFREAVQMNDPQKIYTHLLTIHTDAGRQYELEKTVNTMIAKFKQDPEMWISCGTALLKIGMKDKSRHIMQRALQSLPTNQHVNLMVRFAQLENKFGEKERSQTLFEQVLSSYPKRTDIWSAYVDSLVKSGDIEIARKVLDRAITQALPPKKMKVLFKKYINFERKHGTPEKVSCIQEVAVKYIEEQCKNVS